MSPWVAVGDDDAWALAETLVFPFGGLDVDFRGGGPLYFCFLSQSLRHPARENQDQIPVSLRGLTTTAAVDWVADGDDGDDGGDEDDTGTTVGEIGFLEESGVAGPVGCS